MSVPDPVDPVEAERRRRQRGRNIAVGLILGALVVLIFAVTIVKIKLGYYR